MVGARGTVGLRGRMRRHNRAFRQYTAMKMNPAIVWFRDDLRLADNPALVVAWLAARPAARAHEHQVAGVARAAARSRNADRNIETAA
jgi:hypothetical protein